jgi:hypothetical protein
MRLRNLKRPLPNSQREPSPIVVKKTNVSRNSFTNKQASSETLNNLSNQLESNQDQFINDVTILKQEGGNDAQGARVNKVSTTKSSAAAENLVNAGEEQSDH